jgi:hypothetical protein
MTGKKWFLVVAAVAFVGWIAYLGYAVAVHRLNPPDIVSRSQLVEAEYVVVVEVTVTDGKPNPTAEVVHRLAGDGPEPKADTKPVITVTNLPEATTPTNAPLAPGRYMLSLTTGGRADPATGPYKIAGWPRGLGEVTTQPGVEILDAEGKSFKPPKFVRPPVAYPWSESVRKQMTALGYKW